MSLICGATEQSRATLIFQGGRTAWEANPVRFNLLTFFQSLLHQYTQILIQPSLRPKYIRAIRILTS
jgi:hypothetical protein